MNTITRAFAALPRFVVAICGALGVVAAIAAVMAAVNPEWIEEITGLSPDGGSGEAELAIPLVLGMAALLLLGVAIAGVVASRAVARSDPSAATS